MPEVLVWILNIGGWPLIHLATSWFAFRLPASMFEHDTWLYRQRAWEDGGQAYRRILAVHRWKMLLPDGARFFGGAVRKELPRTRDVASYTTFITETRRAEWAHIATLLWCPVFFLWNPLWAAGVMVVYAFASNVPCIVAQRYNRIVLTRIRENLSARSSA